MHGVHEWCVHGVHAKVTLTIKCDYYKTRFFKTLKVYTMQVTATFSSLYIMMSKIRVIKITYKLDNTVC